MNLRVISHRTFVLAMIAALFAAWNVTLAQGEPPPPSQSQPSSPSQADTQMTTCAAPVATVIVIEAQPDTSGMAHGGKMGGGMMGGGMMGGDQYARLRIAALARIARSIADKSGCFKTLESDPALLALPGGVQPDLVLRVRAASLKLVERTLIEKGVDAARRYAGRYLGGGEAGPDVLQAAQIALDLICPKQRRVIQEFRGEAARPSDEPRSGDESADAIPAANRGQVEMAYARAQDAALVYLRAKPAPC